MAWRIVGFSKQWNILITESSLDGMEYSGSFKTMKRL
jgi:hypothetical protein